MDLGLAGKFAGIAGAARGLGAGPARLPAAAGARSAAVSCGAVGPGQRAGKLAKHHRAKPVTVDSGPPRACA